MRFAEGSVINFQLKSCWLIRKFLSIQSSTSNARFHKEFFQIG